MCKLGAQLEDVHSEVTAELHLCPLLWLQGVKFIYEVL